MKFEITDIAGKVTLNNGLKMPYFGLGVYLTKEGNEVIKAVEAALDYGYRAVDTAAFYKNEAGVGTAIRSHDLSREEIFVTTKVWNSDQGYDETMRAFDRSIGELGFDYIDLYLVHWPVKGKYKQTWRALERIYKEGRVKSIGVSNFLKFQLEDLLADAEVVPVLNQMEFHPYLVQQELIDYCTEKGIHYQSWSPLMRGEAFGVKEFEDLAAKYKKTLAQVILRWNLQKGVIAIPKSITPSRIQENGDIFDFELSPEDIAKLDAMDSGKRIGPDPANFDF